MPDDKDDKERRHPWPPPAKAECYKIPYFLIGVEPTPAEEREKYGKDEDTYTLISVLEGERDFVYSSDTYAEILEAVIQRACVPVFKATPRLLAEVQHGEPRWKNNYAPEGQKADYEYRYAPPPEYFNGLGGPLTPDFEMRKDLQPAEAEKEKAASAAHPAATGGTVFDSFCQIHQRQKHKDGTVAGRGGTRRPKYACPDCKAGKPHVQSAPTAREPYGIAPYGTCPTHNVPKKRNGCSLCRQAAKGNKPGASYEPNCPKHGRKQKGGVKDGRQTYKSCRKCAAEKKSKRAAPTYENREPFCKKHNRPKHKNGTVRKDKDKGAQLYACPACVRESKGLPPLPLRPSTEWRSWPDEQKREHFIEVVRKSPAFKRPSDVEDIAHNMIMALTEGTRDFDELHDPEVIKKFIKSVNRLSYDNFKTISLDEPMSDDEDAATFAEFEQAPEADSDPHQQLEAKEAVALRLNGNGESFAAPVVGDTRETNRGNGHHSQQDKLERPSLNVPVPDRNGEDSKQSYASRLEAPAMNSGQELIAQEDARDEE